MAATATLGQQCSRGFSTPWRQTSPSAQGEGGEYFGGISDEFWIALDQVFYLVLILDGFGRWSTLLSQLLGVMEANVGHGWIGIKFGMNWDGFGWILEMDLGGS